MMEGGYSHFVFICLVFLANMKRAFQYKLFNIISLIESVMENEKNEYTCTCTHGLYMCIII